MPVDSRLSASAGIRIAVRSEGIYTNKLIGMLNPAERKLNAEGSRSGNAKRYLDLQGDSDRPIHICLTEIAICLTCAGTMD